MRRASNTSHQSFIEMQILFIDLESSPLLGYSWNSWKTDLISIEKESALLSIAWKVNDGKTQAASRRLFTEKQLASKLWKLFDDADVIVGHNGDGFDIKVANKFFLKHGMTPPSPYKTVDTLKLARRYFRFGSNRLDYLSRFLFNDKKLETGMNLWFAAMAGEQSALVQMENYNKHDVDLLYKLYNKLRVWHTGHPNSNVYNGTTHQCPQCSGRTQKRGFNFSRVGKTQRYQCRDCGAWSTGERLEIPKPIR